jgi:hypothetical protein
LVKGNIILSGGRRGPDIVVPIRPSVPLNPSFDECGCAWGRFKWERGLDAETDHGDIFSFGSIDSGQRLHETLLDLDGPSPLAAITELLILNRPGIPGGSIPWK